MRRPLIWGAAVVATLGALLYLARRGAQPAADAAELANASRRLDAPSAAASSVAMPAASTISADTPARTTRDRAARDALRRRIYDAFGSPISEAEARRQAVGASAGLAPAPPPIPERKRGKLDADYVQQRIREDFVPLAQECYEAALEAAPELAGKLVLEFEIVGDESVGGVVERVDTAPGSDFLADAGPGAAAQRELVYCMRESMLSLSFEPPEAGGSVKVKYPFVLSPGDGGAPGGPTPSPRASGLPSATKGPTFSAER